MVGCLLLLKTDGAVLGYSSASDPAFKEAVEHLKNEKEKVGLFRSLETFNQRATELQGENALYPVLYSDPVHGLQSKSKKKKLGHSAGYRVLVCSEQLLIYSLAVDLIQSGAIILAPEHDVWLYYLALH